MADGNMADIWTIISSVATAGGVLVGAALVAYQLRLQRKWHIQHSTLEMATRFVEGDIFEHWVKVRSAMAEKRPVDKLKDDEKKSLLTLLSYFETIGVMRKHQILDTEIIFSAFSNMLYELHAYTAEFLPKYRIERGNPLIYEGFEALAVALQKRTEQERAATVNLVQPG